MNKVKCEAKAKALEAKIHDTGYDLRLEAPNFKTVDGDIHEYVYPYDTYAGADLTGESKSSAWKDMWLDIRAAELNGGFPKCETKDCDWCADTKAELAKLAEAEGSGIENLVLELKTTRAQKAKKGSN